MRSTLCGFCTISLLLLSSCISERELLQHEHVVMRDISPENISGNYSNYGDSSRSFRYFYNYIIDYNSRVLRRQQDSTETDSLSVISLEYNNDDLLEIRVFQGNSLVKEIAVKVKGKDDVLLFRRHFFLIPIPFLFYFYDERRMALVSDVDGNLHVYRCNSSFGWILMAAGQDYSDKQVFRKLK